MRHFTSTAFALVLLLPLTGCNSMMLGIMGMHKPKVQSEQDMVKQAHRYGITSDMLFRIDTALFSRRIGEDRLSQALLQPAQIRVYDPSDTLQAILANCHVGGFPNLKWKRSGWTERFPPSSAVPHDSAVYFSKDIQWLKPLPGTGEIVRQPGRPAVVLVWTRFLGRQSKRMVRYAEELRRSWPEADWYYVNMDDLYLQAEF